jgi:heat shock protein HslJ
MRGLHITTRLDSLNTMLSGAFIILGLLGSCGGSKTLTSSQNTPPSGLYKVIEVEGKSISETQPTLNFDLEQNRITGSAGCNQFGGSLIISQEKISVDSLMTTKMYCSDAVMAIEYKFLRHIGRPMQWTQNGDTLSLSTDEIPHVMIAVKTKDQ